MNDITAQAKMTPLAAAALVARRGGDADTSLTIMAQICLLVCGVTALAVSAHIKIPFYPVPLTMQTLVVLLIGMSYGSRLGGATVLAYLGAGAAGAGLRPLAAAPAGRSCGAHAACGPAAPAARLLCKAGNRLLWRRTSARRAGESARTSGARAE